MKLLRQIRSLNQLKLKVYRTMDNQKGRMMLAPEDKPIEGRKEKSNRRSIMHYDDKHKILLVYQQRLFKPRRPTIIREM